MAHKVKAVIFDQDGLMFDTVRLSVEAWNIVGKRFGISVGDEFFDGIRGSKPDTVKRDVRAGIRHGPVPGGEEGVFL